MRKFAVKVTVTNRGVRKITRAEAIEYKSMDAVMNVMQAIDIPDGAFVSVFVEQMKG